MLGLGGLLALAAAGVIVSAFVWSGVTLAADPSALARIAVEPFAGHLAQAVVVDGDGRAVPLAVEGNRLTPAGRLDPGELVAVTVVVRRPGWLAWALGGERRERLVLRTPAVRLAKRWLTVEPGSPLRLDFDGTVSVVAYGAEGRLRRRTLERPARSVLLDSGSPAGTLKVAAAARPWERLGEPVKLGWFPPANAPVVLASPAPGTLLMPTSRLRLTFSTPVDAVFGSGRPKLTPTTSGHWRQPDAHTLVFLPSRFGAGFDDDLALPLPRAVAIAGRRLETTRRLSWKVRPASILRLNQLLAQAGYLPVDWSPKGKHVPRTLRAQLGAAVDPPHGAFSWRYPNTPPELLALWGDSVPTIITRGAVMTFQDEHGLAVDGIAGDKVWRALIADTIAGKRRDKGYSYVYVHRNVPQSLTLWHNGGTVLTSPGNTGVPAAPTQLGTFPVFEHIPVGTMSGTNPDGSHYNDPGVRWISYFNGGDAIHAFPRASFGTPQSLGCVELPEEAAKRVWPYTPIGTLVTVED